MPGFGTPAAPAPQLDAVCAPFALVTTFDATIEFPIEIVPFEASTPPPVTPAEPPLLSAIVEFVIVVVLLAAVEEHWVAQRLMTPPPSSAAELPAIVELSMVSVPAPTVLSP